MKEQFKEIIGDFAKESYDQGFIDKLHDDIDYERLDEVVEALLKLTLALHEAGELK